MKYRISRVGCGLAFLLGLALTGTAGAQTVSFNARRDFAVGSPRSIAVADFNGDGILDLGVADASNRVSVLLGNGDGGFRAALSFGAGVKTRWLPERLPTLRQSATPE